MNLSIKNVPPRTVAILRERARRHHRSLQGELLCIVEDAAASRRLSAADIHRRTRALGLRTPAEAAAFVREDRDGR